jgi:hypothetical protein
VVVGREGDVGVGLDGEDVEGNDGLPDGRGEVGGRGA